MYLNIALESGNLCADDSVYDTDSDGWPVDWERGLVYNFTEADDCKKDPGSKPNKEKSVINLSMRGRCFGACPTQDLPPMFRNKRRKRNLQDNVGVTESKYFLVGGKKIDTADAEKINCSEPEQCYDMIEGKCCGSEDCDCPIVSMSECDFIISFIFKF